MSSIKVKGGHGVTTSLPSNADAVQVRPAPVAIAADPQSTTHRAAFSKKKASFPPAK